MLVSCSDACFLYQERAGLSLIDINENLAKQKNFSMVLKQLHMTSVTAISSSIGAQYHSYPDLKYVTLSFKSSRTSFKVPLSKLNAWAFSVEFLWKYMGALSSTDLHIHISHSWILNPRSILLCHLNPLSLNDSRLLTDFY